MRIAPALAPLAGLAPGVIEAALTPAPYLQRLARLRPDTLRAITQHGPRAVADAAITAVQAVTPGDLAAAMAGLRRAKQDVHLALALGDLSGVLDLEAVTGGLSAFADAALASALAAAAADMRLRGRLPPLTDDAFGPVPGFFLVAMGKYGAGELNYSSDVDITAFFDRDRIDAAWGDRAGRAFVELVRLVARLFEEVTEDGYVFRVDLRLRPDPGSTQPAVSVQAAETYYESFGQNWERAALIKARVAAGDAAAGGAFLESLTPFIWRKHLDFAAIADIHSIKRQILAHGRHAGLDQPGFDLKLGRGGIRDIEFFVQTQQLILGGRDPSLRVPRTLQALDALVIAGRIGPETQTCLDSAYRSLRALEHRAQMINDEQTHRVPDDPALRARLAGLAGYGELACFDSDLRALRAKVLAEGEALFPDAEPLAGPEGSLVFTGVEDDPETLRTLVRLGYDKPSEVAETVRGWHHGRVRATRSPRARELLTALIPRLLQTIAETGEADLTFARFRDFFAGLSAGVQLLSLFQAEPRLLQAIVRALGLAPRLAAALARQPAVLDALIDPRFLAPVSADPPEVFDRAMAAAVAAADGFEQALDLARRAHRELAFRIGFQALDDLIAPEEAQRAFTALADASVRALLPAAIAEVERLHGALPGAVAVAAWGKHGGGELAVGSDLDLMLLYDPSSDESVGPRALPAETFFAKVAQRLVTALSAPTAEGTLYEVDLQLRPSGKAGPIAVRIGAFERYYGDEAWTWELLALTRLRPVAGDAALCKRLEAARAAALARPRDSAKLRADAADMRARMRKERPGGGLWELKLSSGGLVDLEFAVQTLCLLHAPGAIAQGTQAQIATLAAAGALPSETAARLSRAAGLLLSLRQLVDLSVSGVFDPATASQALRARIAAAAEEPTIEAAAERLALAKAEIAQVCAVALFES